MNSAIIFKMQWEKILHPFEFAQLVLVIITWALAIATDARIFYYYNNIDLVPTQYQQYIVIPDVVTYNVAIGTITFVVFILIIISSFANLIPSQNYMIAEFILFVLYLASFIQLTTSDLTHSNCTNLADLGGITTAYCTLPKVNMAFAIIMWIVALVGMYVFRTYGASGYDIHPHSIKEVREKSRPTTPIVSRTPTLQV